MKRANQNSIKRGEIYWYDFGDQVGSIQQGYRPVVVLQANTVNANSETTIIAPLTSIIKKPYLSSHVFLGKKFGLYTTSMILIEQIATVNQAELKYYIGKVNEKEFIKVIRTSIMKTLGLWYDTEKRTGDVRCLCKKHLEEYKLIPGCIIKRFDPLQVKANKCDKCDNLGYDYLFFDKKDVLKRRGGTNE